MLKKKEEEGELKGLCNGKFGPPTSNLFFADDSIFFAKSDLSVKALKSTLQTYCEGSGQKINFSKSSVFFEAHSSEGTENKGSVHLSYNF